MDGKLRYRLSVFLVCMIFSSIMWGMIKLTHEYEVTVKFDVAASALPKGKILVGNTDSVISITLKAKGLDYYSRIFSAQRKPLYIDLENLRLSRKGDLYYGYARSSRRARSITDQLPSGVEVIAIDPDTLHFVFEKSFTKNVPVKTDISLNFSKQYNLYDSLRIKPDSIKVTGRRALVDTIQFISTKSKSFDNLKENLTTKLALIKPDFEPPVNFSADSVEIRLSVEKFTEVRIDVPVKLVLNAVKGSNYRTYPEKVTITCMIAMKDYNRLDPSLFSVVSSVEDVSEFEGRRIPVRVDMAPSFVKVMKLDPEKVEYLIIN
jgi:hypothetical protein